MRMRFLVVLTLVGCGSTSEGTPPLALASSIEIVGGDGQTDTVAQALPLPIVVRAVDTVQGVVTPVEGQLVNFVVTSGGGHLFVPSVDTDSTGRAQNIWTLGPTAGAQCLEARAMDGETPVTFATVCATAVAGVPAHLTIDTARQFLTVDSAWNWRSRVLTVTDQYGNPLPVARAQAQAPGLVLAGDSVTATVEADGWLRLTAGATDSLPWSARWGLQGTWAVTYRCSGPKVLVTGNDGVTPLDSASYAGTAAFTIQNGGWHYASSLTVIRYLQGGATEQAPTGDDFPVSQGVGTVNIGGEVLVRNGTGYSGGDFCGASLWTTRSPVTLTR